MKHNAIVKVIQSGGFAAYCATCGFLVYMARRGNAQNRADNHNHYYEVMGDEK